MFSRRASWPLHVNRLHQIASARRAAGTLIDLTVSNPTDCGFAYPGDEIIAALGNAAALQYRPSPAGLAAAREAVSAYYAARALAIAPDRILLTASTSEAYSHLFRLLCDAGDDVLMPAPTYPLFEMLAGLHDVRLAACPMFYSGGWHLDFDALLCVASPRTRAVLLVHPNNPTGSYIKPEEWLTLRQHARERNWALVVDEVFYDYAIAPATAVPLALDDGPLIFLLNGFSKIVALPQMKLGWVSVHGEDAARQDAFARLEVINDLYLSVDAPIQHAAARILARRHGIQDQIRARLQANLDQLDRALAPCSALERLAVEGGWSAVVRLPSVHSDEEWAELLLNRAGVLTHPGHFYEFQSGSFLVLSLLQPTGIFRQGVDKLIAEAMLELNL
ncbi:MAG TPA: pyridoxal phosphate-dependent aminotransferase [Terriglobales bacterium]|nr:pyridoxal phosphate-dependent aminotransferase [Terriglobales bacterium]